MPFYFSSFIFVNLQVQSYKFVPLVYQIASRMGSIKDGIVPNNFQVLEFCDCLVFYEKLDSISNLNYPSAVCLGFSCEENGH